jgi:anti-repressor protein
MNELAIIDQQDVLGKSFTIYGDFENPLFLARDVASWIDYDLNKVNEMVSMVEESEKLTEIISWSGQNRKMWFLTEDGLYEVLMQSRKPIAKAFKREVKEILRTIRMRGLYATPKTAEAILNDPDIMIRILQELKSERENRKALEKKVEQDKPLVAFGKSIENSTGSMLVREFAKIASNNPGITIGQNRLFDLLREKKYLMWNNEPYQSYIDNGWFETKEIIVNTHRGSVPKKTTLITGKGQIALMKALCKHFGVEELA